MLNISLVLTLKEQKNDSDLRNWSIEGQARFTKTGERLCMDWACFRELGNLLTPSGHLSKEQASHTEPKLTNQNETNRVQMVCSGLKANPIVHDKKTLGKQGPGKEA